MAKHLLISVASVGLLSFSCAGCGAAAPGDEPTNEKEAMRAAAQPIVNGFPAMDDATVVLRRWSDGWSFCTGTMVRNDYVVTAKHCLTDSRTQGVLKFVQSNGAQF